jgi:iron complex outermembrane recepter protein
MHDLPKIWPSKININQGAGMKARRNKTGIFTLSLLTVAINHAVYGADAPMLDEVVVTAPAMEQPLVVETDPRKPRQPVPAHDGADYLKTIPGFSVIRKGGTDGDPVFRGMAGSRLNILLDGENILGGCGQRMDPPTAYVFPSAYDKITVLKGPQSVLYGAGNSAGTVMFERDSSRNKETGLEGSVMAGSFGRRDVMIDAHGGSTAFDARGVVTRSHSDDYQDGNGDSVHSAYTRWSANATLGLTPNENTRIELSAAKSDGEAAYADRSMDGAKFARDNVGLKGSWSNPDHGLLDKMEAQVFRNYIDHVMDNYSLRTFTPSMMMPNPSVSNPDRLTTGGRAMATLNAGEMTQFKVGADTQKNIHTLRSTMNQNTMPYENMARVEDANFTNSGLFGEARHMLNGSDSVIGGLRTDWWEAQDQRANIVGMMGVIGVNPTANQTRNEMLKSGFIRYETDMANSAGTVYAGLGHTERFPDYWELISKESATTLSAFDTRAEKTNQLDAGLTWKQGDLSASLSGFYSKVSDFILIESGITKGMRTDVQITRNVDATTWGGEAGATWQFAPQWKVDGSLAYTRGTNDTDNLALAQIAPLEGRVGMAYDDGVWNVGGLLRMVAAQERFAVNQGNIVGQDIGRTAGFAILSLNTTWRANKKTQVSAGVDNLTDRVYAEHLSRGGTIVAGFPAPTTRVNEMGRMLWLKANFKLD